MRLDEGACWQRLRSTAHGVLGTVHERRGVDLVPVVFVVVDGRVVIPIDTVKAKGGARLQRLTNLTVDSRCTLLVERYADDWAHLWWVRAHGLATESAADPGRVTALGAAFPAYREPGAVASLIVVSVQGVTGWSAAPDPS